VPPFKSGGVAPEAIELGINGVGDLDIVMWFGSAILVCELKCQKYPGTEVERARYMERLADAAIQLRTRRAAISVAGGATLAEHLREYGYQGDGTVIEYAIVVNTPFGALQEVGGFPVVDDLILMRYVEGFAERSVGSTRAENRERTHVFYKNEEDAAA